MLTSGARALRWATNDGKTGMKNNLDTEAYKLIYEFGLSSGAVKVNELKIVD